MVPKKVEDAEPPQKNDSIVDSEDIQEYAP